MSNAYFKVPQPVNEPIKLYKPGSTEREELKKKLSELKSKQIEVPLIIGGEEVKTGNTEEMRIPHNHKHVLGVYHKAGKKEVEMAIEAALEARKEWAEMPWEQRGAVFLKLIDEQPYSPSGMWNRSEYRPLEGFIFAVTPFNFTSIAGNLPTSPAIVGNVCLWKPASSAVYSAYYLMKLFEEAGLPKG